MGNIVTNVLRIGEDNLLLQDAGARQTIQEIQTNLAQTESEALGGYATDTATGAIASFPDGADNVPVKSLTVDAESGHTQAVVTRTGFNVWDEEWQIGDIDVATGQNKSSQLRLRSSYISVKPNTAYYICIDVTQTTSWFFIFFYDSNKNYLGNITPNKNTVISTLTNTAYIRFVIPDGWGGADYVGGISINYPSTDHDYHAYTGQQYIIDLNGGSTETDITTIKGQNNIWADIGDVEVEYRADTKLYIQKVLNA